MTSMHRAVMNWLKECDLVTELFFSFGTESNGACMMVPSDSLSEEYIDGSQERTYTVQLTMWQPVSFDPDNLNVEMLETVDAIADWINAQGKAKSFPAFPEGKTVTEVSAYNSLTGYETAQNGLYARYVLPFTVTYIKE